MRCLREIIHDGLGIDGRKMSGSLKETMRKVKDQKKKLRNCEKVRRLRS